VAASGGGGTPGGRRSIQALSSPTFLPGDGIATGAAGRSAGGQEPDRATPPLDVAVAQRCCGTPAGALAAPAPAPCSVGSEPFPQPQGPRDANSLSLAQRADALAARGDTGAQALCSALAVPANEDALYLKKNVEHLRSVKHHLAGQVQDLEARVRGLEQRTQQYKMLYEQAQRDAQCRGSGELEISSLHQQLTAVVMLKDALNSENMDLQRRLEAAQKSQNAESKQAACVICMDNLANIVCLPCKHLALCSYCQQDVADCPICRSALEDKMQIFTP